MEWLVSKNVYNGINKCIALYINKQTVLSVRSILMLHIHMLMNLV